MPSLEERILSDAPTATNCPFKNRTRARFPYAPAELTVQLMPFIERATAEESPTPTKTPLPKATEPMFLIEPYTVRRTQESSGCCAFDSTQMFNSMKVT